MFHVVDDNLIGGRNTAKIVELFDAEAMHFTSAVEYLEYARSPGYRKPSAIFTDVFMYGVDGYELIEEILAIYPDQKFVVITGRPDLEHASKSCACFHLSKPFYAREIQQIISKVRQCEKEGPSPEVGCAGACNRTEFALKEWSCPHS